MHIIILLLIGFLLSCCTDKRTYPKAMLQAENCIITYPDSALFYLSTLKNEIKNEPEETQMYYNLLTIKAEDKLYIPHTSDSLIKVITKFYEEYDDNDKLMEAYYYMGSTYRDMKDAPRALRAFQDAVDVSKDNKRYDLLAQTYGQMGTLFIYQGLQNEALNANKQALHYHSVLKNEAKISIAIRNIARIYDTQKIADSAQYYYHKAYNRALKSSDENKINSILGELGCFYYDIGKTDSAKTILLNVINKNRKMINTLLNLGLIYQNNDQIDSAKYYFYKTIELGDVYKQRYAFNFLSHIEADQKNYRKALDYAYKYQTLKDSIDIITQTEAITKIQALYNYQHTEKENTLLKLDNERKKAQLYKLLLALACILIISGSLFFYYKKKKQIVIMQERKLRKLKEELYAQSLEYIEDNIGKINTLELQIQEVTEEKSILNKQLIQLQKELLELSNRQVIVSRKEQDLLTISLQQSEVYLLFHKACNDTTLKITEENWSALEIAIDRTYQKFTDRLYKLYPRLSLLELRICYLIKISMQVKDIANLVNRSKPAITAARIRLYKKIHGKEGTGEMLDNFIINL